MIFGIAVSILRSVIRFSFFTFLSKISGFMRDVVLANFLGVSALSDAFFIAFRLPNLFRAILADGALNVVFTPIYACKQTSNESAEKLSYFVNNAFTMLTIMVGAICLFGELIMPIAIVMFAPGLDVDSSYFDICVESARIMFPYLLCVSLCALMCGVLQARQKFGIASLNPIILNICMIGAAIVGGSGEGAIISISKGVLVAGVVQVVAAILCVKIQAGHNLRFVRPHVDQDADLMLRRFAPAAVGACATRVSIWIDTVIASIIPKAVSYIYYADRLYQIPRSLVGVAISYVMLPELSRSINSGDTKLTHHLLNRALEVGYMLCIPAAVGLAVLSDRLVDLLFIGSVANATDLQCIARAVVMFSIAIPSVITLSIVNTMFFASGDTKTPVSVSFVCIAVNAAVNLILIRFIGYMSVPIATAIGSWLNAIILIYKIRHKFGFSADKRLTSKITMTCFASCCMAFVMYMTEILFLGASGYLSKIMAVILLFTVGFVIYVAILRITKTYSIRDIRDIFGPVQS